MTLPNLRLCRSLLFLPASNPRAIEKARSLPADMIILDCEDAVKPQDKDMAREAAVEAVKEGFGDRVTAIRVNPPGGELYGRVKVGDSVWSAKGPDAEIGTKVRVAGADGTCLKVEPLAIDSRDLG